jgi:hypothetical protein
MQLGLIVTFRTVAVICTRFGPTAKIGNLNASQFLLHLTVSLLAFVSMVIFNLLPLPLNPTLPIDQDYMFLQATLQASGVHV